MRRRRMEFVFLFILIVSVYMIVFSQVSFNTQLFFIGLYVFVMFITIYSLMLENRFAHDTLLWMYVLLFFPVFGYVFYLFSGQLYLKGYLFQSKRKKDREEWKSLVTHVSSPDLTFLNNHQKSFAAFAKNASETTISTASKTEVLKNGNETFSEIIKQLKKAEKFIHIEYYIFRSDRLGTEIIDILIEKAKKGVEVLFIFDAAGSLSLSNNEVKRMKKAGVKAYPFSPLKHGFFNQKFNFRNHRKIIIIDGEIGFVGGLNIGEEYLGRNKNIGFWRDTHMVLEGEAVYMLHTVFLLDWEYVSGEDVLEERQEINTRVEKGDGAVQVVASGPDTQQGIMSDFYYSLITCATKSIWIASPYFVPNQAIKAAIKHAALKGIQVRLMVPAVNDGFLTQYGSRSYFGELLQFGVEVYSYKKGFLHQKLIIVDGDIASIGTANMDMRSFHLNFEVNVFLMGSSSINDLVTHYQEDMKDSEKLDPLSYNNRGLLERSKESFARLFSNVL
ncbi:cardiolipin synthase [Peribacillus butanolivorans]|uniref:cardiolipin synthase n=1 Tax=Peribacillus butanolivorans TaxID=421767 RepID=UPI00207C6710|nr:cardiolipin synthase [Peribacillus butanolivorans]MCO0599519.1 cardiolipin synthase [Peribacillus butanolivorans]